VTETGEKGKDVWGNRLVRFVIVALVFPTLVTAFHVLLIVPVFFVDVLLVHLGGNPKICANTLFLVSLLSACCGAAAVCKWIWPSSK
jgi:hypothetical protein